MAGAARRVVAASGTDERVLPAFRAGPRSPAGSLWFTPARAASRAGVGRSPLAFGAAALLAVPLPPEVPDGAAPRSGPVPQRRRDDGLQRPAGVVSQRDAAPSLLAHARRRPRRSTTCSRASPRWPSSLAGAWSSPARSTLPVLRARGGADDGARGRAGVDTARRSTTLWHPYSLLACAARIQRPARAGALLHAGGAVPGGGGRARRSPPLARRLPRRRRPWRRRARVRGAGRRRRDRGHAARRAACAARRAGAQRARAGAAVRGWARQRVRDVPVDGAPAARRQRLRRLRAAARADVIEWALRRHDPTVLTELRRGRPLYVLVASTEQAPSPWTAFMDAQPGADDARDRGRRTPLSHGARALRPRGAAGSRDRPASTVTASMPTG